MRKLLAADLFCGAGGTSAGAEESGAVKLVFGLNHWSVAIDTHSANHPTAKHVCDKLDRVAPSECGKIDLLFASPKCTHFSRARTGPTNDQDRADAWDVMKWIEYHRPSFVVCENVVEFKTWGPVGSNGRPMPSRKGAFFDAWIAAIKSAGYAVDFRELVAADFGAHTSRKRLFVIARKGNRYPSWPEPTHAKTMLNTLPFPGLNGWNVASDIIESMPGKSITDRRRRLADATVRKIEEGRARYGSRFLIEYYGTGGSVSVDVPLPTITTRDRFALVDGDTLRMLTNHELAAAQGFRPGYVFCGTQTEITCQIGNSVSPPVAKAISISIAS